MVKSDKRNFYYTFTRAFTHLSNIIPDFTDNNLINIIRYGQDYYASSEVNYMNQIDPATLETVGRVSSSPTASSKLQRFIDQVQILPQTYHYHRQFQINYRNHIALNLATAHPHYDDEGNTYNMGTAIMGLGRPKYVIFKVPADASGTAASVT